MRRPLSANPNLPQLNRNTVENPNLPGWLEDCANASLILAVAPAGFGKTTAILGIHEHLREAGVKTVWIQLSHDDNHLDRFCRLLYDATSEGAGVQQDSEETNFIDAVYTSKSISFRLQGLFSQLTQPTAIFLDDFDHITDPDILQVIQSLIEQAKPQCRFIIAARAQPQLKLLKLRAQGKVVLIGYRELAFDLEQTRSFFNERYRLQLDDASVEHLHQTTEGWPTGLQLAALAMEKRRDREHFIKNFQISTADIDHYLNEEVFLAQSQEVQRFLLKTSVVTELNVSLANAIADTDNSAALLRNIEQQNLFLLRVGDTEVQYRFHPLFAEYLRKKLHDDCHSLVPGLHRKAAEWYLANEQPGPALDHFLLAKEPERMCEVLATYLWVRINAGQLSDCRRWLDAIPSAVLDHHLDLLVAKCWLHIFQHDYVRARNLAYRLRNRPELANNNDYKILEPLTLALMDQPRECAAVLASQLDNVTFTGPVAGVLHTIRAAVAMWSQQFDQVAPEIDQAQAIFRQYGSLYGLSFTMGIEAYVLLAQANIGRAITVLEHGIAEIEQRSRLNSVCSAHLAGYLAEALYECGEQERACQLAADYFDLTCANGMAYTIVASFRLLARRSFQTGALLEARELIERGIELGRQLGIPSVSLALKLELQYQHIMLHDAQPDSGTPLVQLHDIPWERDAQAAVNRNEIDAIQIMQCRIWIRTGQAQRVIDDAPVLIAEAEQDGSVRVAQKLRVLLAQALDAQNQTAQAIAGLDQTVQAAAAQQLVATFLEEGPRVTVLLKKLAQESNEAQVQQHLLHILRFADRNRPDTASPAQTEDSSLESGPASLASKEIDALSDRELQILQCLAAGMPNKSIAGALFITEPTVKFHLRNINSKLRAKNRTHAVFIGRQLGLIH